MKLATPAAYPPIIRSASSPLTGIRMRSGSREEAEEDRGVQQDATKTQTEEPASASVIFVV